MRVALLLCPDAAPESLVEDARRLRWIAGLLRELGAEPLAVIATQRLQRDPALVLAGCSLTAEGLDWTLVTAETEAALARRLALGLQAEGARLALYYDWPGLPDPGIEPEAGNRLEVAVVRRAEAGGPGSVTRRLCLSPALAEHWAARSGPAAAPPPALPEPLPGLGRLRALVRAVAGEADAGPAAQRLLVAGGPFSAEELRPVLAGVEAAWASGLAPAAVQLLCLPRAEEEAALLALVADYARRWPWSLTLGLASGAEAVVRAAARPGTLTLLPDRGSLCAWELRLFAALGLPALAPDLPRLRAQVPAGTSVAFHPAGGPEGLARALVTAAAEPPQPVSPPPEEAEVAWRSALRGLLAALPHRGAGAPSAEPVASRPSRAAAPEPPQPPHPGAGKAVAARLERAAARLRRAPAPLLASLAEATLPFVVAAPPSLAETAERLLKQGAADTAARLFCEALFARLAETRSPAAGERLLARLEEALARGSRPAEAERLRAAVAEAAAAASTRAGRG